MNILKYKAFDTATSSFKYIIKKIKRGMPNGFYR